MNEPTIEPVPCHCGFRAVLEQHYCEDRWKVHCIECHASTMWWPTPAEACARWELIGQGKVEAGRL